MIVWSQPMDKIIEYKLEQNPNICPYCNSDKITAGNTEYLDPKTLMREVNCHSCNKEWEENFTLTSFTDQNND